jgi:hypothetical protein
MRTVFRFPFSVFRFPQKAIFFYGKQKTENGKLLFKGFGLFDEHNGNIIFDFVKQAALVADEAVAFII